MRPSTRRTVASISRGDDSHRTAGGESSTLTSVPCPNPSGLGCCPAQSVSGEPWRLPPMTFRRRRRQGHGLTQPAARGPTGADRPQPGRRIAAYSGLGCSPARRPGSPPIEISGTRPCTMPSWYAATIPQLGPARPPRSIRTASPCSPNSSATRRRAGTGWAPHARRLLDRQAVAKPVAHSLPKRAASI
jgi:hypothetical protein